MSTWVWETNFIPDVRGAPIDSQGFKGAGVRTTNYEIGGNSLVGHLAEWPMGRYHKAHHHGGGAVILILKSRGYTLMWPQEAGIQPYQSGHTDQVVRVDWQEGSVVSPPPAGFTNTSIAVRYRLGRWRFGSAANKRRPVSRRPFTQGSDGQRKERRDTDRVRG